MQLRVEKILSLNFRHEFFKLDGQDWAAEWPEGYTPDQIPKLEPTNRTRTHLGNLGLYLRNTDKGIEIFASVKEVGNSFETERPITGNPILDFYLVAPNQEWKSYTKMDNASSGLASFSNLNGLQTNSGLFLHDEIPPSAAGVKEPGALIRSGKVVYEAEKRTNTQPPGADWTNLGDQVNFTSLANKINYNSGFIRLSEGNLANALVEVKDRYENVVFTKTFDAASEEKETSVSIDHLPDGEYSWYINGTLKESFYLAPALPNNTIGLVSICFQQNPSALPANKQLDEEWLPIANGSGSLNAGIINPREFVIHFLSKRALWQYTFSRDLEIQPSDIPSEYQKINNKTYQSKEPIAINRTAIGADFGLDQRLPAANTGILTPQLNGSEEVETYVSEIYVNV